MRRECVVLADIGDPDADLVARTLGVARVIRLTTLATLKSLAPGTLVVNLVTHFGSDRRRAAEVAGALEVLDLPFTGARSAGLLLASDAATARAIVSGAGVPVAQQAGRRIESFAVIGGARPLVAPSSPLDRTSRHIARELRLDGYARIDYCKGQFLQADARPRLTPQHFGAVAGLDYTSLLALIVRTAHARRIN